MNIDEVSQLLGISRATIMRRVKDGNLTPLPKPPLLKRHYKLQFNRADVERLAQGA